MKKKDEEAEKEINDICLKLKENNENLDIVHTKQKDYKLEINTLSDIESRKYKREIQKYSLIDKFIQMRKKLYFYFGQDHSYRRNARTNT